MVDKPSFFLFESTVIIFFIQHHLPYISGAYRFVAVFQLSFILHQNTFTPQFYSIDEHVNCKIIHLINIMHTSENLFLLPDEMDNEGNLSGLKTAGALLKDFRQAIRILLLLSTLVTLIIYLFVPGVY